MFDVESSMFGVQFSSFLLKKTHRRRGTLLINNSRKRHSSMQFLRSLFQTSNFEHPTSNAQLPHLGSFDVSAAVDRAFEDQPSSYYSKGPNSMRHKLQNRFFCSCVSFRQKDPEEGSDQDVDVHAERHVFDIKKIIFHSKMI